MVNSMTGFATLAREHEGWRWTWDLRSVNARGLDLRLRMPDWLDGLDQPVRATLGKNVARGNVTLGLKLSREEGAQVEALDPEALARVLEQLKEIASAAQDAGVAVTAPSAADILGLRGILSSETVQQDPAPLVKAILDSFPAALAAFTDMRAAEGKALQEVLERQFTEIETLTKAAGKIAEDRKADWAERLRSNLARVLDNADGVDEARLTQELAVLAVKSDVTEELDRLTAHVAAARELLAQDGPIGRKLDFLSQEFNREANTLCAKAQSKELTRIGLDLKAVIDQMREQVQNVE